MTEEQNAAIVEAIRRAAGRVHFKTSHVGAIPNAAPLAILDLLKNAVSALKGELDAGTLDWRSAVAQLDYVLPETVRRQVLPTLETPSDELRERLLEATAFRVMADLTAGITLFVTPRQGEEGAVDLNTVLWPEVRAELAGLPDDKRKEREEELKLGWHLDPTLSFTGASDAGSFACDLNFQILPFVNDVSTGQEAQLFWPHVIALTFHEGDPTTWSETDRADFWSCVFKSLDDITAPFLQEAPAGLEKTPKPDRTFPRREQFAVSKSFVPMHHLSKRNPAGLPLFQEESHHFHEIRTPLNWAVGLAMHYFTSERVPGGWQEVTIRDLQDQVFNLTDRNAPRHSQQREDVIAEVVKLHTQRNYYVRYEWERRGRAWHRNIALGSDYIITNLELVFRDKKGRRILPSDPSVRKWAVPLELDGRRVTKPGGKDIIKTLPRELGYFLDRIRWRWNPSVADDLKPVPALDTKGNVKRDAHGKVMLTGYNISAVVRIFNAMATLRAERAYVACDLLVLLALDIYKPPRQSTTERNVIEREADRLYDQLGLEYDPKNPNRREETVAGAIYRLKKEDIGALLPGSDEYSRSDPNPERRKGLYYRLIRSPEFTPRSTRSLVTKEEAEAIAAEYSETTPAVPEPTTQAPEIEKVNQLVLPGLELAPAPPIPSGKDIRAAREVAGINLREFARMMNGPAFKTWANYETGKPIRVGSIPQEIWQRVRDFIAQYGPKPGETSTEGIV